MVLTRKPPKTPMTHSTSRNPHPEPLTSEDLEVLGKNPILHRLDPDEFTAFVAYLEVAAFPGQTSVIQEGDEEGEEASAMFFLLSGQAQIRQRGYHIRVIESGDNFGELEFVGLYRRAATVRTTSEIRVARLTLTRYNEMGRNRSTLALRFLQLLVDSLGRRVVEVTESVTRLLRERSLPRRLTVEARLPSGPQRVENGTPLHQLLPREVDGAMVVAGLLDNRPVSLESPLSADAAITSITAKSWEGRQVYRRSIGLVVLEAARRFAPEARVALGASLSFAQVVLIENEGGFSREELVRGIEKTTRDLIRDRAELREELWTVDEARTYFVQKGWHHAVALLNSWRDATVQLFGCGETFALSMGPILTNAGDLVDFEVTPHPYGFMLHFGTPVSKFLPIDTAQRARATAQELDHPRFAGKMADDHRRWLKALGIDSVGAFNDYCISGQVVQVTRVAEGFHEKRLAEIADQIGSTRGRIRVIRIAGPSASGKTTFIKRLTIQLAIHGIRSVTLSLDDYYVDREKTIKDESGEYDFEAFEAINSRLLARQLGRLIAGDTVRIARYDFKTGKSHSSGGPEVTLHEGDVVILEGIHGLNPRLLCDSVPKEQVFSIFIHPAIGLALDGLAGVSPSEVRLIRRIVRDRHHRNYKASETILRWPSVRRGELLHIYPFQPEADVVFDTSLVYELSVLKVYADRYLMEVPPDHQAFPTAFRLRRLLDRFVTIYPDHVPPTSLLREFIGGSGFEY